MKAIPATGGTGYIGSHTAVELIHSGYQVIIADDLSNSSQDTIERIEKITGHRPVQTVDKDPGSHSRTRVFVHNKFCNIVEILTFLVEFTV